MPLFIITIELNLSLKNKYNGINEIKLEKIFFIW